MADFAQGLLKFAAADPTKATTQQLAEAFSDLPEKAKEATIQKRAIELAESGLEADQAIALADRERGVVELNIKLRKALADSGLEPQELDKILEMARTEDDAVFNAALQSLTPRGRQAALSIRAARGNGKGPKTSRAALAGRDVSMTAASEGTKK